MIAHGQPGCTHLPPIPSQDRPASATPLPPPGSSLRVVSHWEGRPVVVTGGAANRWGSERWDTAEVLGDYCAGPNHVLPTSRTARFSSPLGVYDFQKRSSLILASPEGAANMAKTASVLARGEGLTAHARSAEYRGAGTE